MPTALLGWECGAGFGHLMTLRRLAAPLLQRGWNVVAGLSNRSDAHLLTEIGVNVVQAPVWQANGPPTLSSVSWADILADLGLRDAHAIRLVITGWEQLLSQFTPAIVVCETAPGLALAAQGRVPSMLVAAGRPRAMLSGKFGKPPMPAHPLIKQNSANRGRNPLLGTLLIG